MDVIVDGKRGLAPETEQQTVLEVLGAVDAVLRDQGRVMTSVRIDGVALNPEELQERAESMAVSGAGAVEVESEDVSVLVKNCLQELQDSLEDLPDACHSLAAVFQSNHPEDGYAPFERLAQIWHEVKHRQLLVCRALDLSESDLQIKGVPFAALHAELNQFLAEAADAIEAGDCVTLGDLLEYELAPRAEAESDIVAVLQEHAQRSAG